MKCGSRIRHIHVTSRLSQYLHFAANTARISISTICQGEVSMHKSVSRSRAPDLIGQTSMLVRQSIAKRNKLLPGGLCRGRFVDSMVQMDFHFSPAGMTKLGQLVYQLAVVLLGGIEIAVRESTAFAVAKMIEIPGILFTPDVQPFLLHFARCVACPLAGQAAGLKVVGERDDQV